VSPHSAQFVYFSKNPVVLTYICLIAARIFLQGHVRRINTLEDTAKPGVVQICSMQQAIPVMRHLNGEKIKHSRRAP